MSPVLIATGDGFTLAIARITLLRRTREAACVFAGRPAIHDWSVASAAKSWMAALRPP